jgi:hypothetical protein
VSPSVSSLVSPLVPPTAWQSFVEGCCGPPPQRTRNRRPARMSYQARWPRPKHALSRFRPLTDVGRTAAPEHRILRRTCSGQDFRGLSGTSPWPATLSLSPGSFMFMIPHSHGKGSAQTPWPIQMAFRRPETSSIGTARQGAASKTVWMTKNATHCKLKDSTPTTPPLSLRSILSDGNSRSALESPHPPDGSPRTCPGHHKRDKFADH